MSSGFISSGTTDNPIERDDEWLRAQQEIEANRRRREEESRQDEGKTLYEILQGNKAAKEEAFQESVKLKNQFRNLDEDEVEFLDSVLESTRAKEEAVKKETTEQLSLFRRQQEEADKQLLEGGENTAEVNGVGSTGDFDAGESQWIVNGRKRKRTKEKEGLKGLKIRKSSSTHEPLSTSGATKGSFDKLDKEGADPEESGVEKTASLVQIVDTAARPSPEQDNPIRAHESSSRSAGASVLGLAGYSSEED